jgi:hypothetical protein
MADEQIPPSAAPAPTDAAPASPPSEPTQQEPQDISWFRRLLRRPDPNLPAASADGQETSPDGQTSTTVQLSQEELERRIQAETDRREYRRAQQQTVEQRRKLRDSDPYAFAEQERNAEQQLLSQGQFNQLLGTVGATHDRASIDPIVEALEPADRERIMKLEGAGIGLDGRALIVKESLKALEKRWKAEGAATAEARLRKNSTFRKQVFAEYRGSRPDPELLPSAGNGTESDHSVSDLLRRSLGRG